MTDAVPGRLFANAATDEAVASKYKFSESELQRMKEECHTAQQIIRSRGEVTINFHHPCWHETDDGLPPPCRHPGDGPTPLWKLFNPRNPLSNDNLCCVAIGNVGFKFFGRRRKYLMGAAMWSTFFSIAFTIAGCCALSMDPATVIATHWTYIEANDSVTGNKYIVYVGLRSFVYKHSPCDALGCQVDSYEFTGDPKTMAWPSDDGGYIKNSIKGCVAAGYGYEFGACLTCFTLIFALMGCINRMR